MKKIHISLVCLFLLIPFGTKAIEDSSTIQIQPKLEVQLSPGNSPTQRVNLGEKSVEVLRIWLTASDHEIGEITLEKLRFLHKGEQDHFLRYKLMQANRELGTLSLVSSDTLIFNNISVHLTDGKTAELRILADVATHDFSGEHRFSIPHPDYVFVPKNDIRDPETKVVGDFPIESNRIIIGESFESPDSTCNLREEPVCGEDGKTYYNLCIPFQKSIKVDYEGPCYQEQTKEIICSEEIHPVCGDDGRTYPNQCFLEKKENVFKKYNGECFPENFVFPRTFQQAVDLFDRKVNELRQLRPRISDNTEVRLSEIMFVLRSYDFTVENVQMLVRKIGEFLEFSRLNSKRIVLEQEVELLNSFVISARSDSAKEKYEKGLIPFRDVDKNAWFLGAVQFLKTNNYLSDFVLDSDLNVGFFRPGQFVTKAEVTDLLFDMTDLNTFFSPPPQNSFAKNHWAHNVIAKAEELGLSMWDDLPNPGKKVTRFEILQLILEIFEQKPGHFTVSSFRDVTDQSEISIIEYARHLGLISGYPDGSFRPKRLLSRAEAGQIVHNAYKIFQ